MEVLIPSNTKAEMDLKGGNEDDSPMRPLAGQIRGDAAAERVAIKKDALGGNLGRLAEPIVTRGP